MECLPGPREAAVVELDASVVLSGIGILVSSMGDGEGSKRQNVARTIEMENLSLDISSNRFSRDLLQRFRGPSRDHAAWKEDDEDDDVELNLGLSLGGRFGVDKSSKTLVRSSSIASCLPTVRDDNDAAAAAVPPPPSTTLTRTSSLPVQTEEEWRKRKEMQSLRRMEAKRRRSEKQRNLRIDRETAAATAGAAGAASGGGNLGSSVEERKETEVNLRGRLDREKTLAALRRSSSSTRSQLRLSDWTTGGVNQASGRTVIDSALDKGKKSYVGQPVAQGSVESRGGSSSSMSDLESRPRAGSSDEISPASIQSFQESGSQDAGGSSAAKAKAPTDMESPSNRPDASRNRGREVRSNSMEDMPCVFTRGDGPNGRRVDGILYKYGKGEEVRIMCICHGTFHSPAEFVLHAGGTDVDTPLKHIVVNPNDSSLL